VADRDNLAVKAHDGVTAEQFGVGGYVSAPSPQSMLQKTTRVVIEVNHHPAPVVVSGFPVGEEQIQRFPANSVGGVSSPRVPSAENCFFGSVPQHVA
jgi:hypothetical protein